MSDKPFKMTDNTAKYVAAVLATPSQWATTTRKLLDKVAAKNCAKDKRVKAMQLMLFMQHTQACWKRNLKIVGVLRNKLEHFITVDKWEPAIYFKRALFPEHAIAMA
jgi:hypothetical protein